MLLCLYTYVTINVIRLYMNTLICSTIERGKQNMDETWYPSSKQLFMNNLNKTSNSISPKKEWVKMKYEWMPLLNATRLHLCTWRTIKPSNHEHIFLKARYCSTVTFTRQELNCRVFCILIVVTKCYPNYSCAWLGRISEQLLKIWWYTYIKVTVVVYQKKSINWYHGECRKNC